MGARFDNVSQQKLDIPGPVTVTASKAVLVGMCWARMDDFPTVDDFDFIQYASGLNTTQSRFGLTCQLGEGGRLTVKGRAADAETLRIFTTAADLLVPGRWQHLCGVLDYAASRGYIYIDGELAESGPVNTPFTAPQTAATSSTHGDIGGGLTASTQGVFGRMEDVRLYGAHSPAAIATIAALHGKDSVRANLLHRFPLKDASTGNIVEAANIAPSERMPAVGINAPFWSRESVVSFAKKPLHNHRRVA